MNIVNEIADYLNSYMVFPDDSENGGPSDRDRAEVIALWVLHTYTFSESFPRRPYTTPYLYITSEGPRSGKTLLIDLLEPIVLNPERTINMTSSVMFRLIEHMSPTLFYDEVDTIFDGTKQSESQNVINGGYKASGYVWRNASGPDGPEPKKFRTFSPKLLAGIDNGKLPETVLTRCIEIRLRRVATLSDEGELIAPDGSKREIFYAFMVEPIAERLVARIQAWVAAWKADWTGYMPKPIPGIDPRAWEITFPLVQVARRAGIEDRARQMFARLLAPRPDKDSPEIAALRTIKAAFDESGQDRLFTREIVAALGEGWNGKLFSNRIVKHFNIGSSTTLNMGNQAAKGYGRYQFEEAFSAYL